MSPIDERLKSLNIVLPDVMPPVVDGYVPAFAPFTRSGDQIHLSGRLGKEGGKLLCGKVGEEISLDQGKLAARHVAIELLAVLKAAIGDLGCVRRIVKLFVMVNGAPHFTEPHRVADGASELLVQVFGERGIHSRSAVSGSIACPSSDCHAFRSVFVFTPSAPAIQVFIPTMGAFERRQLIVDFVHGHFAPCRWECNGNDDSA
jgi:enamine deaminase RidA (YjgF/YER057c/UK114 family)